MHDSNLKRTKSSESLLFFEFPKHLVSFYLLQQHVKERSRVSHLSRGNNRHTPLRGFRKKTHSHADNPTIKAVTDASIYPTKIQKIFETTKFFMPEMTRFLPGFVVTLSHWGYISVRCLLPCRRWPPGSALISPKTLHCHIVTLGHYYGMPPPTPDTPTSSSPPPTPPRGGERTAGSRLKKDNNRKKNRNNRRKIGRIAIKIEKNRRNRDNRRIEIIENNRKK